MDRIRQLKLAMSRLKKRDFKVKEKSPKKSWSWRHNIVNMTEEEILARKADDVRRVCEVYKKRRSAGLCIRCKKPSVVIVYELLGKRLIQRTSLYCPQHWESKILKQEMLNAIASGSKTVPTVHPYSPHGFVPGKVNGVCTNKK